MPLCNPTSPHYLIQSDNTTKSISAATMPSMIPKPLESDHSYEPSMFTPFLWVNSKIMFEHDGQYHKGYITKLNGIFRFSFRTHVNIKKEDWG